jgi:uncharacterized protein VirK/YbjX
MSIFEGSDLWSDDIVAWTAAPAVTIASGAAGERRPVAYLRELVKLAARALVHRRRTQAWLQLLNSHPAFAECVRHWPRMLYKIYRPYLTLNLDMDERLAVIAGHYRFLFGRGMAPLVVQAVRAGVPLAHLAGKSGTPYTVQLRAVGTLEREGELALQLCADGAVVYSLAFTILTPFGAPVIHVGCIQGPKTGDGLELNRQATRELHGLRPKQLLLTMVRQLGYGFGCAHLQLVGNGNRVVRSALKQGKVRADYDAFWSEAGATRRADGDFQLACLPLAEPDMAGIPSRKRSEARFGLPRLPAFRQAA